MRDADLAKLYELQTFNLNKAVKRNLDRFPGDFMFQFTEEETESLTFQTGISKRKGRGGGRTLPLMAPNPPRRRIGFVDKSGSGEKKKALH